MEAGVTIKHTDEAYHIKLWYSGDDTIPGFQVMLGVRHTEKEALELLAWYTSQLAENHINWHEWKKGGLRKTKNEGNSSETKETEGEK